ncbi:MAG: exonuclease domain-containing protein [Actinomycetaceae bacterium]|nr:exonuclease domain-containing protein [Actinomycetaceae bacterium]
MDFRPPGVVSPELGRRLGIAATQLLPLDDEAQSSDFLQSVWSKTYVVVDLETTGLSASDAITEIGAVKVSDNKIIDTFATLINPHRDIPPKITSITGITNSMVEGAPELDDALRAFLDFADLDKSVLVAHNAAFDTGFLSRACDEVGIGWKKPRIIDTLALARTILPRPLVKDHRLGTLAKFFAVTNPNAHRALADAYVTAEVLSGLVERLDKAGARGYEDLDVAAQTVPYRHRKKASLAKDLPTTPGIYKFLSADGLPLYVGSATNLRSRVRRYFSAAEKRRRITAMLDQVESVEVEATPSTLDARILELNTIRNQKPLFNSASRHQDDTAWLVRRGDVLTTAHTISPAEALRALGPYRRVTHALKAREAILLALGKEFDPLKEPSISDQSISNGDLVDLCLRGRGHLISGRMTEFMTEFSARSQYELAARIRDYFAYYLHGIERQRDTALVAGARKVVWAHHLSEGGWRIHAASRGRLLGTRVTAPKTSPVWAMEELAALDPLPDTGVHLSFATWEEARVLSRDLNEAGARLIEWDSDEPFAWAIDSDLSELPRWANLPSPKRGRH